MNNIKYLTKKQNGKKVLLVADFIVSVQSSLSQLSAILLSLSVCVYVCKKDRERERERERGEKVSAHEEHN
jgi:hypothetical protein